MSASARRFRINTAGFLAAAFTLVLACGGDDGGSQPSASSSAPAATARESTGATPVPDPQITEREIPDGFPKDVPLYPGAQSERSLGMPGGPTLAAFSSDDDPATVLAFYASHLPAEGWEITNGGDGRKALRANKDGRSLSIRADAKPGEMTNIAIVVNQG